MNTDFSAQVQKIINSLQDAAVIIGEVQNASIRLHEGAEIRPGLGLLHEAQTLQEYVRELQDGIFRVMIAGDFKNGKSSLLNALLGEALLPTGNLPITPFITLVEYGNRETVELIQTDQAGSEYRSLDEFRERYQLSGKSLSKEDPFQTVLYAIIQRPHAWLSNGVQLVDSPGLRENTTRDERTLNFLKHTHAVIIVLDATKAMSVGEQKLIESLFKVGPSARVFFVINQIDKVSSSGGPDAVKDVKESIQHVLRPCFQDADGKMDETLFEHRVFFISALQAIKAQSQDPVDQELLEASEILPFRSELLAFLGASYRLQAVRDGARQRLIEAGRDARYQIRRRSELLHKPLEGLEAQQHEVEQLLKELEEGLTNLNGRLFAIAADARQAVYESLNAYLETMQSTWEVDAAKMFDLKAVLNLTLASALDKQKLSSLLEEKSRKYLQSKFERWVQDLPLLLTPYFESILRETLLAARNFEITTLEADRLLSKIETEGSSGQLIRHILEKLVVSDSTLIMDKIKMGLPNVSNNMLGLQTIGIVIQQLMYKLTTVPWLAALAGGALVAITAADTHQVYKRWGEALFKGLREEIQPEQAAMYAQVEQNLLSVVEQILPIFRAAIEERRSEQQALLAQLGDTSFEIQEEEARLQSIEKRILDLIGGMSDPTPKEEDLLQLLEGSEENQGFEQEYIVADPAPTLSKFRRKKMLDLDAFETGVAGVQEWIKRAFNVHTTNIAEASTPEEILAEIDQLIGLQHVKGLVRKLVAELRYERDYPTRRSSKPLRNLLFLGNPGTGKTTIARYMGKIFKTLGLLSKGQLVEATRSDLVAPFIGQTAPMTREKVESALDGVLFIDEAYTLAPKDAAGNDFGLESINELNKLITDHSGRLVVIAAGYTADMRRFVDANPGIKARFPYEIEFPDYTPAEQVEIYLRIAQRSGLFVSEEARRSLPAALEQEQRRLGRKFANARSVEQVFQATKTKLAQRITPMPPGPERNRVARVILPEDLLDRDQTVGTDQQISYQVELTKLDGLIGLQPVKQRIRRLASRLAYEQEYSGGDKSGESLHMVFIGNPGTGKTTIARQLGEILRTLGRLSSGHLVETGSSELVAGYIGQTALKTAEKIDQALNGVLFIDEAYSLMKNDFGHEAIDQLVKTMYDYRDRMVVIMAGYPEDMKLLLESNAGLKGRFADIIEFPDYSMEELLHIFRDKASHDGLVVSVDVEQEIRHYLESERNDNSRTFSNGRSVENLYSKMKDRLAERIMVLDASKERDQAARSFLPQDVPTFESLYVFDSYMEGFRLSELLPPAAADRIR